MKIMEVYSLTYQERKIKLKPDQLTIKLIGKIFSLFPDSIILLSPEDGTVETPDESGIFTGLDEFTEYEVDGEPASVRPLVQGQSSSAVSSMTINSSTSNVVKKCNPVSKRAKFFEKKSI